MLAYEWRDAPVGPKFAVLGDPIAHSKSPEIHSAAMAVAGISSEYVRIRVPTDEFNEALEHLTRLGYLGLNITVPLKEAAYSACLTLDDSAKRVQAVNTLVLPSRHGFSTDAQGFFEVLAVNGVQEGKILVLGTGGTARTLLLSDAGERFRKVVWGRNAQVAEQLASIAECEWVATPETGGFDVVVNATSASLQGIDLPMIWQGTGLSVDTWYGNYDSPWMRSAQSHGWKTVDGKEMLIQQAAKAFKIFHGVHADLEVMREAIH